MMRMEMNSNVPQGELRIEDDKSDCESILTWSHAHAVARMIRNKLLRHLV
jgi:hypothetical protein